jgi:signal transduction histidine kinase
VTRPLITRIAFGVVIAFVLAQVVWWVVFQQRYIASVTEARLTAWQRDAEVANAVLIRLPGDSEFFQRLEEAYPHLRLSEERFVVDAAAVRAFRQEQGRLIRMFAFEGPFFVLVVLLGLAIIAQALRRERELKKQQQNFLSAITHEFKTPLSSLRLLIETALYRPLPPEKQRHYLQRMKEELERLEQTSEQVLASARLEQADEAPVLDAVELNTVVQGIVGRMRKSLEARGAVLHVHYSPEPLPVSLDAAAFGVVLGNLLDNAVKYSPGPKKPVWLRLEARGPLVVVQVEDAGLGVPESERERIFERFYRSGHEDTRASQGVGLGLHLVRSITEAMNGWVKCEVNDRAGQGTRFSVILPRRTVLRPDEEAAAALPTVPGNPQGHA